METHLEFAINFRLNEDCVQCFLKVVKHSVLVNDFQAEQSVQKLFNETKSFTSEKRGDGAPGTVSLASRSTVARCGKVLTENVALTVGWPLLFVI